MRTLSPEGYKVQAIVAPAFPDAVITKMEVGDWFEGEIWTNEPLLLPNEKRLIKKEPHGNLVEIKIGDDFGIHTEQLERFQDECYRMACYRQQNPHVCLHAVWVPPLLDLKIDPTDYIKSIKRIINEFKSRDVEKRAFDHLCYKYHIWGHVFEHNHALVNFLKVLNTRQYTEFEPFIKRSHEEPTDLAKALRIPNGVSSELAIDLSIIKTQRDCKQIKGLYKKDKTPSKLWYKIRDYLCTISSYYHNQ